MNKPENGKKLYNYQLEDLNHIFERFENCPKDYNLLYQLPTGGGKTVIFSEIARRYIENTGKKVLILTHRIELCGQTSRMLEGFGVKCKVIDSKVKELLDQDEYACFVAMVETLNNRLNDEVVSFPNVGLVIVDEAHYNSFRKLFKFFEKCFILGVTATPLSSNIKLPMKEIYNELIVGRPISFLIKNNFLAKGNTYSYDVRLGSLKLGINGDYTVKSSEVLYSTSRMQSKLLYAYEQRAKGKKTLIFNNGILTSKHVFDTFNYAGYKVRHLDNTANKKQRQEILTWFKNTPDAILTSVSILTTGFDEPSIETIILNRATRSLSLYFQMIGRGSRFLPNKPTFDIIDLGNNSARFGLWELEVDWQRIFRNPNQFLENLVTDEMIERSFKYVMPEEIRKEFAKTEDVSFDIDKESDRVKSLSLRSFVILETSIDQHVEMVTTNSVDLMEALGKLRLLDDDINDRVRRFCYVICKSTKNYRDWAQEEYKRKLKKKVMNNF